MTALKPAEPTHLPSPPPSPSLPATNAPSPTVPSLTTHLDALLTSYLTLLDTYTTLRTELSSTLSSGFLSLAAANRNAATILGPGRRFGEEGFDGRMKATRVVRLQPRRWVSRVTEDESKREDQAGRIEESEGAATGKEVDESTTEADHGDPTPPFEQDAFSTAFSYSIAPSTPSESKKPRDPLHWFTALPPPALRQTQQHFIAALDPMTRLLEVSAQMAVLEERVREARSALEAAAGQAEGEPAKKVEEVQRQDDGKAGTEGAGGREGKDQVLPTSSRRGHLASRSRGAEPRSRVLKIQ